MRKEFLYKLIYLFSVYIIIFSIAKKYFNKTDIILISFVLLSIYLIANIMQEIKIKHIYILVATFLPFILVLISPYANLLNIIIIFILTLYGVYQTGLFNKSGLYNKRGFSYRLIDFQVDLILIMAVFVFTKIYFLFFAVLMKLMVLAACSINENLDEKLSLSDLIIFLISLITSGLIVFVQIYSNIFSKIFIGIYNLIAKIISYLLLPFSYITAILVKIVQHDYNGKNKLYDIFSIDNKWFIIAGILIAILLYRGYVKSPDLRRKKRKTQHFGMTDIKELPIKEKANSLYNEKIEYHYSKKQIQNLSKIRELYKNLLQKSIKLGFKYNKGSTAKDVADFMQKVTVNRNDVNTMERIYETERYKEINNEEDYEAYLKHYQDILTNINKNQ